MANKQREQRDEIGMVGWGVMGRNSLLNMADHGFSVAGYDKAPAKVAALRQESWERDVRGAAGDNPARVRPHCSGVAVPLAAALILRQPRQFEVTDVSRKPLHQAKTTQHTAEV